MERNNENILRVRRTDFCIWHLLEAFWITMSLAHILFSSFMARLPLKGHGLLIVKASRTHSHTPHSVGLHWKRDRTVAETYNWQRTTITTDIHTPDGFEPAIPARERPHTHTHTHTHTLDHTATGIGHEHIMCFKKRNKSLPRLMVFCLRF
jgi:hypothetical protein